MARKYKVECEVSDVTKLIESDLELNSEYSDSVVSLSLIHFNNSDYYAKDDVVVKKFFNKENITCGMIISNCDKIIGIPRMYEERIPKKKNGFVRRLVSEKKLREQGKNTHFCSSNEIFCVVKGKILGEFKLVRIALNAVFKLTPSIDVTSYNKPKSPALSKDDIIKYLSERLYFKHFEPLVYNKPTKIGNVHYKYIEGRVDAVNLFEDLRQRKLKHDSNDGFTRYLQQKYKVPGTKEMKRNFFTQATIAILLLSNGRYNFVTDDIYKEGIPIITEEMTNLVNSIL